MAVKTFIVVGLAFGDEGKGLTTDYLCMNSQNPIVIRYNGGHQAGHTVVTKMGQKHVFSSFGSGTLRNVPTYWSRFCTLSPAYLLYEYQTLSVVPKLYVDNLCPITTHYDVLYNRALEATRGAGKYGSCGLGFGATIDRLDNTGLTLVFNDLLSVSQRGKILKEIRKYYKDKINEETRFDFDQFDHNSEDRKFEGYIEKLYGLMTNNIIQMVQEKEIFNTFNKWGTFIFEGAQGILLDRNFGNYPYITKSNTTCQNAIELLANNNWDRHSEIEVVYVSRAYQTRHGNGPFAEYRPKIELKNCQFETNKKNEFQGPFRINYLDIDKLNYALSCDMNFSSGLKKHLVLTCLDQIANDELIVYKKGVKNTIRPSSLPEYLECKFSTVRYSYSQYTEDLR
ncbi:adenylosuccinate synthetase [Chitinophaga agrisoli]|uniref:Adenylosuccinate synthetase n=1 Tax=Chitinophaga agrisoli TaxID=2607653 RepID=A0A5B2VIR6_9BACT|nr:adenylosuccinate synthetase [Chitinophaga agrisoli]KAA2238804.1 adenylosuccinate synthetase [Chitinophaga agrisoli]